MATAEPARALRTERDDSLLTVAQAGDYLGTGGVHTVDDA
jgi:hypothetical protein